MTRGGKGQGWFQFGERKDFFARKSSYSMRKDSSYVMKVRYKYGEGNIFCAEESLKVCKSDFYVRGNKTPVCQREYISVKVRIFSV